MSLLLLYSSGGAPSPKRVPRHLWAMRGADMALYGVSFTLTYIAWDTTANAGKTADVANHTLRWVKDGVSAAPTNAASEVDATNAPGVYKVTLTAAEAQAYYGSLVGRSATASVSIMPVSVAFERLPDAAPGSASGIFLTSSYTAPDNATIASINTAVDTEVAAIKAKTDSLTFTTAGKVDATINAAGDFAQAAADKAWSTTARTLTASLDPTAAQIRADLDANSTKLANLDAAVSTRSTYAGGAVASVTGAVGSVAAGGITAASFGVGAVDAAALSTDAGQEIADRVLARNMAGGSDTGRTVRSALAVLRNKVEVAGSTLTVYAEDDVTILYTAAVTSAAGNPLTGIDPV